MIIRQMIEQRLITDFKNFDTDLKKIDYNEVNKLLNNERKKSLDYISNALLKEKGVDKIVTNKR